MKLAIMQPYLFPYLGYFQLIEAVDKFVIYDDVAFIKQGWINRNNILINDRKYPFTIPLLHASSFKKINETIISERPFNWDKKLLNTFRQAYKKAPYFKDVFPVIEKTFANTPGKTISSICFDGIKEVTQYLSCKTVIVPSSSVYNNQQIHSVERILDICKKEQITEYVNVLAGINLYEKQFFSENKITLQFIKSNPEKYQQYGNQFIDGLSIIDVLMFNSAEKIRTEFLPNYSII